MGWCWCWCWACSACLGLACCLAWQLGRYGGAGTGGWCGQFGLGGRRELFTPSQGLSTNWPLPCPLSFAWCPTEAMARKEEGWKAGGLELDLFDRIVVALAHQFFNLLEGWSGDHVVDTS